MTLLATFKHISSKNADYGAAEAYLTFEHDEFTMKPTLDENGRLIPREDYRISSLNCGDGDFAVACMRANLRYEKNQKREDVKSHHYIISFDPRDGTDNGLTVDRAQELGEQFCKAHFPGHQALICTHPDGHNHSGNIHVHIVINSLRIYEVPLLPYMDRPADTREGCKHRCTNAAMEYFKSEVMEMCHREGLYQIDLLNGSKERITEREYWAAKKGQLALDNLDELNYLASKLDEMDQSDYAKFQAAMEIGDYTSSLQEIINLTENLDCYEIYPNIEDYDDLGRYYLEELEVSKVPAHLQNYIDYEAYGRDVALEENGTFTDQGYVWDTREAFHEYYDGERGSIPDEYRVMTFQDDLPEEEKSEWAMDIAFDMDEFFRQNDPQYAAEHPEAHAAKEELYENLMAGRISALDEKLAALGQTQEDYLPSEIEKFKDATGYEEFLDFDPAEVKAALDDPEKSHADEMLSAAEKVASEKMTVLVVEPMKEPYVKEIDPDLHSLQAEVGGDIGATYPYSDPVALVCNDEGKLIGLDLNRGLRDENGEIYDIVAGTFLVVGLGEEDFASLSPELIQKYTEQFKTPERFMQINGNIVVLPVPAEKQDLAYLPDRFETGERVRTPRGSFQVTAMSREQMEAAGYGVHHISDDGKYLIMGNGTRAFAVAAEQPEKDNPLRTAEMTLEDDYGMIDGVINNGRRGEELEKAQEYAERTTPEKPSIRERLEDAKRECAEHKPPEGKKSGRDVPEQDCL